MKIPKKHHESSTSHVQDRTEPVLLYSQVEGAVNQLLDEQARLKERKGQLQYAIAQEQRAPKSDWEGCFTWDAQALQLLQARFSLSEFRCSHGAAHRSAQQAAQASAYSYLHCLGAALAFESWYMHNLKSARATGSCSERSSIARCKAEMRCASFPLAAARACATSCQPS